MGIIAHHHDEGPRLLVLNVLRRGSRGRRFNQIQGAKNKGAVSANVCFSSNADVWSSGVCFSLNN